MVKMASPHEERAKDELKRRLRLRSIPGWRVEASSPIRVINDIPQAHELLGVFTAKEIMAMCKLPVGKLQDAYVERVLARDKDMTIAKAKSDFNYLLASVMGKDARDDKIVADE